MNAPASTTAPINRSSLQGSPSTLVFHARLSRGGFMREVRCDRYPRLVKSIYRGTRTAPVIFTWIVDGVRCSDLDEALRFLNGPVLADDLFEAASA